MFLWEALPLMHHVLKKRKRERCYMIPNMHLPGLRVRNLMKENVVLMFRMTISDEQISTLAVLQVVSRTKDNSFMLQK